MHCQHNKGAPSSEDKKKLVLKLEANEAWPPVKAAK